MIPERKASACDIEGVSFISDREALDRFRNAKGDLCVPCHFRNTAECEDHDCTDGIFIHPVTLVAKRLRGEI